MAWEADVRAFIETANAHEVRMLMVGGGAVNWHGYKRHSADVDFWVERSPANLDRLVLVLRALGYELLALPPSVARGLRNVSLKFSPKDLDVELITRFEVGRPFGEAYADSVRVVGRGGGAHHWQVLAYDDLVVSKVKAGRPKDLLDIAELRRVRGGEGTR